MFFGKCRKDFSVKRNIFFQKRVDKFAVGCAVDVGSRVDLHVPEPSKIPFFEAARYKLIRPLMENRFARGAFFGFSTPFETAGFTEQSFSFFVSEDTSLYSGHLLACSL